MPDNPTHRAKRPNNECSGVTCQRLAGPAKLCYRCAAHKAGMDLLYLQQGIRQKRRNTNRQRLAAYRRLTAARLGLEKKREALHSHRLSTNPKAEPAKARLIWDSLWRSRQKIRELRTLLSIAEGDRDAR